MTSRLFIQVLLANCLVIICFNLLMLLPGLKVYLLDPNRRIVTGLIIYSFQFVLTRYLLKDEAYCLISPFRGRFIPKGVFAFTLVLSFTVALVLILDPNSRIEINQEQWITFAGIFVLNSLPGALMEEWLFRFFPLRFVISGATRLPANLIFFLILLLFTLLHIPAYLFQYDSSLSSLGNIFVSGIFLLLIYLMTKNVVFTALFHAFGNNPQFLTYSPFNWQYFYASVFLVTLAWPLLEYKIAKRAADKDDIQ